MTIAGDSIRFRNPSVIDDLPEKTIIAELEEVHASSVPDKAITRGVGQVPADNRPRLYVVGDSGLEMHVLEENQMSLTIGSDEEPGAVDVQLREPGVSNKQVVIIRINDQWMLMDCGTNDIVSVNGIPARQFYLRDGETSVIRIGTRYLIFTGFHGTVTDTDSVQLKRVDVAEMNMTPAFAGGRVSVTCKKKRVEFVGAPVLIGRHEMCDLRISNNNIGELHAIVFLDANGVFIDPLLPNSVQLDGARIDRATRFSNDRTMVMCGLREFPAPTFLVQVAIEGNIGPLCETARAKVKDYASFRFTALSDSPADSFELPMAGKPIVCGRGLESDLQLKDAGASRRHVEIHPDGKNLMIKDLGSSNGTYVNGNRVDIAAVRAGDFLQIGKSMFMITYA